MRWVSLALVALFTCSTVAAEPSKAFLKCERMLAKAAQSHLAKANKLRDRFARRIDALVEKNLSAESATGSPSEAMPEIIRKIVERASLDDAHDVYVRKVIDEQSKLVTADDKDFECSDPDILRMTYELNLKAYGIQLDGVRDAVVERYEIEHLGPEEGLVAIAFNTNVAVDIVRINRRGSLLGSIWFGPVFPGEYFRVVKMRAGEYNWDEITQRLGYAKRLFDLSKRDSRFTIEAGKLNYAGVFLFEVSAGGYYRSSLNDRQTIVLTILDQRYPELLEQYEIANAIHPDDRFIEYYLEQKRLANNGDSGGF